MYICLCHGITDRQIRRTLEQGASSLAEVQQRLPVGSCCGCCVPSACELIREHAARERDPAIAQAPPSQRAEPAYA